MTDRRRFQMYRCSVSVSSVAQSLSSLVARIAPDDRRPLPHPSADGAAPSRGRSERDTRDELRATICPAIALVAWLVLAGAAPAQQQNLGPPVAPDEARGGTLLLRDGAG